MKTINSKATNADYHPYYNIVSDIKKKIDLVLTQYLDVFFPMITEGVKKYRIKTVTFVWDTKATDYATMKTIHDSYIDGTTQQLSNFVPSKYTDRSYTNYKEPTSITPLNDHTPPPPPPTIRRP